MPAVDAVCLSGGSAFGLDAASGVMHWLASQGRGYAVGGHRVPIVPAAILFDLHNGGDKAWGAKRSEEHTSELQSLMRTSSAVFCLEKTTHQTHNAPHNH